MRNGYSGTFSWIEGILIKLVEIFMLCVMHITKVRHYKVRVTFVSHVSPCTGQNKVSGTTHTQETALWFFRTSQFTYKEISQVQFLFISVHFPIYVYFVVQCIHKILFICNEPIHLQFGWYDLL